MYRRALPLTMPALGGPCPFCPEQLTERVVARRGAMVVVPNAYPYGPVSELLVPSLEHHWAWHTAPAGDITELASFMWERVTAHRQEVPWVRVWLSYGRVAAQTQPHVHVQLVGGAKDAGGCRYASSAVPGAVPPAIMVREADGITIAAGRIPEIDAVDLVCAAPGAAPSEELHGRLHREAQHLLQTWAKVHWLQGYNITDHATGPSPHVHVTVREGAQAAAVLLEGWVIEYDLAGRVARFAEALGDLELIAQKP